MDDSRTDEAKGRVKQAAGDLAGDDDLKKEGKVDEAVSDVKGKVEDLSDSAKEKVGDLADKVKDRVQGS